MNAILGNILFWACVFLVVTFLCYLPNFLKYICSDDFECSICEIFRKKNKIHTHKVVQMTKIAPRKKIVSPIKNLQNPCSICLEPITADKVQCCSCGHCFHAKCIQKWLETKTTCPNCRQSCENLLKRSLFQ
jgi:hypothetical protein